MRAIEMVDLKIQYQNLKPEINFAIEKVLLKSDFINGFEVHYFAENLRNFLQVPYLVPCANGTDALQLALMVLDLPPKSEIIIPSFSYIAAAEVVAFLGFIPVFADVETDTFNIDCSKIEALITEKTKAIIPVHLFGQACDMLKIIKIAQKYNLFIIEDNAQSLGAEFVFPDAMRKKLGTIGHIGTTSFFPSKNLGCYGDGGAVFTHDEVLAQKLKMLANHGQKIKYKHELVGINSRLDTLQAAILNVKLKYLEKFNNKRAEHAAFYFQNLQSISGITLPFLAKNSTHVFHQFTLKTERRDELAAFLKTKNIPTMVYYPFALHLQPAFEKYNFSKDLAESEKLCQSVLSLPMHPDLEKDQLGYICDSIKAFFC